MQEEEYTFVTIDSDDFMFPDAVVIDMDMDNGDELDGIVTIDESMNNSDFITLADDTIMLSDADMIDTYSSDISDMDISIMI
ncbi:MAG: hypothetical protein LBJ60_09115 [Tannerellaceae bacterium]|jgi:hypothetical protein|nr:hypothetical protein [Tannerellaceae bacterium]